MRKIISTFIFLLISECASSFSFDLLKSSKDSDEVLFPTVEKGEIFDISDVENSAGLQKDLQKIKIFPRIDFRLFSNQSWLIRKISGVDQEIIPNLYIAKIIYPFHSFL